MNKVKWRQGRLLGDKTSVKVPPPSNGNEFDEDEILYERWLYISAALGFRLSALASGESV